LEGGFFVAVHEVEVVGDEETRGDGESGAGKNKEPAARRREVDHEGLSAEVAFEAESTGRREGEGGGLLRGEAEGFAKEGDEGVELLAGKVEDHDFAEIAAGEEEAALFEEVVVDAGASSGDIEDGGSLPLEDVGAGGGAPVEFEVAVGEGEGDGEEAGDGLQEGHDEKGAGDAGGDEEVGGAEGRMGNAGERGPAYQDDADEERDGGSDEEREE
jgi:hypothetical protein